jgi:hypothetical protein
VQYGEAATLMDGDAKQWLVLAATQLQQLSSPSSASFLHQFGLATAYFVFGRVCFIAGGGILAAGQDASVCLGDVALREGRSRCAQR